MVVSTLLSIVAVNIFLIVDTLPLLCPMLFIYFQWLTNVQPNVFYISFYILCLTNVQPNVYIFPIYFPHCRYSPLVSRPAQSLQYTIISIFYICKIYFYIYVQYIILTADTLSLSSPIITVYCRILNLDNRYN